MSHIEKEKLIKADIASIENRVRHAFNQGYDLGFKDGKKRAKPLEQEPSGDNVVSRDVVKKQMIMYGFSAPDMTVTEFVEDLPPVNPKEATTKNDLGVDCISRADALRVAKNEYLRGWHNALCKALNEKYSIHCEEGNFSVIQEETITGLGLSMNCALGKDVESYMSTMPSVTPQEPRKGHWKLVQRGKVIDVCCSNCEAVRIKDYAYNYTIDELNKEDVNECFGSAEMRFCPNCGADMREVKE